MCAPRRDVLLYRLRTCRAPTLTLRLTGGSGPWECSARLEMAGVVMRTKPRLLEWRFVTEAVQRVRVALRDPEHPATRCCPRTWPAGPCGFTGRAWCGANASASCCTCARDGCGERCERRRAYVALRAGRDAAARDRAAAHRILLSVRRRIHCGIGRFCFIFFASVIFVLRRLWDGILRARGGHDGWRGEGRGASGMSVPPLELLSGRCKAAGSALSARAAAFDFQHSLLQHCNRTRTSASRAAISLWSHACRPPHSARAASRVPIPPGAPAPPPLRPPAQHRELDMDGLHLKSEAELNMFCPHLRARRGCRRARAVPLPPPARTPARASAPALPIARTCSASCATSPRGKPPIREASGQPENSRSGWAKKNQVHSG